VGCGSPGLNNVNTTLDAGSDSAAVQLNDSLVSQAFQTRRLAPFIPHYPIPQTTSTPCLPFFGNDPHRSVGRQLSQVLVRYPTSVITAFSYLLTACSQETTIHRCRQDVTRHFQGIFRCVSTPQVVFGRHQRADQALRRTSRQIPPQLHKLTPPSNTRM
jgi:hypothetical protein